MNNNQPLVSVILPTFNRIKLLEEAIKSVLNQSYLNLELIVIDDASTDKTQLMLSECQHKDKRIRVISNKKNLGFVRSLNEGIKEAKGYYVARIDDDDAWIDNRKLEKQVDFLEKNPEYIIAGGGMVKVNENGEETGKYFFPESDAHIRNTMLIADPFVHSSVVFRADVCKNIGGYDEFFDYSQDWDLWARLGKSGKMYNFQEIFVQYLQGAHNRSNKKIRHHLWLNQKVRVKHRGDYCNFWRAYLLGFVAIVASLPIFRKATKPFLNKARKLIIWKNIVK